MKLYENMHRKLMRIIPNLADIKESAKLKSEGYMDLNVDVLNRTATYTDIALSHYYRHPSGDMIADPDMEIRVWHYGAIEALTFQDCFGYKRVYETDGERTLVYPTIKKSLNSFLNTWLSNIIEQGHTLAEQDAP